MWVWVADLPGHSFSVAGFYFLLKCNKDRTCDEIFATILLLKLNIFFSIIAASKWLEKYGLKN
jgi:hypothetical protein